MLKIGICGKMCSGKTYIAEQLATYYNCPILSFASKIKEIARDVFNMREKDRFLLQSIGTKLREIRNTVWIDYTIKNSKQYSVCIIDDVRYRDEIDSLIDDGWILIKLNISKEKQLSRLQKKYPHTWELHSSQQSHVSEQISDQDNLFNLVIDMDTEEDKALSTIINFLKTHSNSI